MMIVGTNSNSLLLYQVPSVYEYVMNIFSWWTSYPPTHNSDHSMHLFEVIYCKNYGVPLASSPGSLFPFLQYFAYISPARVSSRKGERAWGRLVYYSAGQYSNFSISKFVRQDIMVFDIITILLISIERGWSKCAKDTPSKHYPSPCKY